jgi:hypothetical protein
VIHTSIERTRQKVVDLSDFFFISLLHRLIQERGPVNLLSELDRSNRNDLESGGELLVGEDRNCFTTHPYEIS